MGSLLSRRKSQWPSRTTPLSALACAVSQAEECSYGGIPSATCAGRGKVRLRCVGGEERLGDGGYETGERALSALEHTLFFSFIPPSLAFAALCSSLGGKALLLCGYRDGHLRLRDDCAGRLYWRFPKPMCLAAGAPTQHRREQRQGGRGRRTAAGQSSGRWGAYRGPAESRRSRLRGEVLQEMPLRVNTVVQEGGDKKLPQAGFGNEWTVEWEFLDCRKQTGGSTATTTPIWNVTPTTRSMA